MLCTATFSPFRFNNYDARNRAPVATSSAPAPEAEPATTAAAPSLSVKDRIRNIERQGSPTAAAEVRVRSSVTPASDANNAAKPKKKKPMSKAFSEFESAGIIIGFVSH